MVLGLMLSLFVKRRRVWVRVTGTGPTATGGAAAAALGPRTVVETGGLGRTDAEAFRAEFEALGERLRQDAPPTEQHAATTAEHDQTTHREQEAT
jgi:cytochrome c biogenesis protein